MRLGIQVGRPRKQLRRVSVIAVVAGAALLAACGSDGPLAGPRPTPLPPSPFLVSNPEAAPLPAAPTRVQRSPQALSTVAWVSLPPGSLPSANAVTIHDPRTGAQVVALVTDGGFDPVAVAAGVGDTLDVTVQGAAAGEPSSYRMLVPATSAPHVVRTTPPDHKRDVPLNCIILVTFSEPMDSASLEGAITLASGASPVAGSLVIPPQDSGILRAQFVPTAALAPLTGYLLEVGRGARDRDGDSLAAPIRVDFTSGAADSSGTAPDTTTPPPAPFHVHVSVLYDTGTAPLNNTALVGRPIPGVMVTYRGCAAGCGATYTGDVTLVLGAHPAGATLGGTTTVRMVSGVAAFTDLSVNLEGVYSLVATAAGAVPDTSGGFQACAHLCWDWSRASMPTPRSVVGVGVVGSTLYAIGGLDTSGAPSAAVEAYDPATNTWTPKAPMPTTRYGFGIGVVNDVIYVAGGITPSGTTATVEAYDPATNTWSPRASLPSPTGFPAAGGLNGTLYVVGGEQPDSTMLATVLAYDPAADQWSSRAPLPAPRSFAGLGISGGLLYVVRGRGFDGTIPVYDPATDHWTVRTPTETPSSLYGYGWGRGTSWPLLPAIGVLPDVGILVASGMSDDPRHFADPGAPWGMLTMFVIYDPVENQCHSHSPLPVNNSGPLPNGYPSAGVVNGQLYLVGYQTYRFVP